MSSKIPSMSQTCLATSAEVSAGAFAAWNCYTRWQQPLTLKVVIINSKSLTENEPRVKFYPKKLRRTNHLPVPEADANADAYELTGAVYILINFVKREVEKASC